MNTIRTGCGTCSYYFNGCCSNLYGCSDWEDTKATNTTNPNTTLYYPQVEGITPTVVSPRHQSRVETTRCNYDTGGYGGLDATLNKIGWENVKQVLPCYCGGGEYFYTIIYTPMEDKSDE